MKSCQAMIEEILEFRRKNNTFQRSIRSRSKEMSFKFYDGPPFTSGDPHYGHLLQSIVKDMIPRRMTMRGYHVKRKWGWDCHGIPAENFVNKKLGITSKKQVEEEFGIKNYVEECRKMVGEVNNQWKWFVDHVGRWVDMENAYFTMDNDFMESVIHLFSDLYNKNLIYKGFKVLGYSWALGTALSNSEIAEGYADRQDPAVTVKFRLTESLEKNNIAKGKRCEITEDGCIEVVAGLIKNKHDEYLMIYHQKEGMWFFPGGKIDKNETPLDALKREVQEETGVCVKSEKFLGHIKIIHQGVPYRIHYFEILVDGKPSLQEKEKHGDMKRIKAIKSENDIGFAIKIDDLIIDHEEELKRNFIDHYFLKKNILGTPGMDTAPIYFLAWTTTPRTLPANMFLAVNKDLDYVMIYDLTEKEYYILAQALLKKYYKSSKDYIFVFSLKGEELIGLHYTPLFDYYYKSPKIDPSYHDKVHRVMHADFVTAEAGTGIAHEAPAFGEDDYNFVISLTKDKKYGEKKGEKQNPNIFLFPAHKARERLFSPVDDHGSYTDEIPERAGINVFEANKLVIKNLKDRGLIVRHETINHSYPHCPRTGEPIIYRATESWFLKERQLSALTISHGENINFVPEVIKKRFLNGLASAPDWNISRTRFWGCPLPIWENEENPEERLVPGSLEEIYQLNKSLKQITKIILIRHGRTDYNEKRICDSVGKAKLTDEGKKQAQEITKIFHDVHIDAIYSSPLSRCKETIAGLAQDHALDIIEDERLTEIQIPALQDKPYVKDRVLIMDNSKELQGGENMACVQERVQEFLEDVVKKHAGETIVIVSHSLPLKLMRKIFYNLDYEKAKKYKIHNEDGNIPYEIDYIFSDTLRYVDFHRPYIDRVELVNPETGNILKRIPEVLDCWFESGSMPYGQDHYMKRSEEKYLTTVLSLEEREKEKVLSLSFYDQKIWDAIVNGTKTIETRALNPEEPERYFGDIKKGDLVKFVNKETGEELLIRVKNVDIFDNFDALWRKGKSYLKKIKNPKEVDTFETVKDLKKGRNFLPGYGEKIEKNGMIAFEFEKLKKSEEKAEGVGRKKVVILHGYTGRPDKNWLPWMKEELEKYGYFVEIPALPLPDDVALEEKVQFLLKNYSFDQDTVVMGHSLGSMVGLKLLETGKIQIDTFISVAGAYEFALTETKLRDDKFKNFRSYYEKHGKITWNIDTIKKSASNFAVIIDKNDPIVPNSNSEKLAQSLGVDPIVIESERGHITGKQEPQLLDQIIHVLSGNHASGSFNPTADFIAEGLDQTRGWFRALHVLGEAYMNKLVYKNVVVTGLILAEDGKKMSKSKKNFPDPTQLLNTYGADAFRLYLLSSPVVKAEPLRFKEQGVEQMLKDFVIPLENVANFFTTYARVDERKHPGTEVYFMRHAEKNSGELRVENGKKEVLGDGETIDEKDIPLSKKGFKQLESQEFIEKVIRINPDIIYVSEFTRAQQTAEGARKILKKYLNKEVKVVVDSSWGLDADEDTILEIYQSVLQKERGKRVLIVSHNLRFRYLRQKIRGIEGDMRGNIMKGKYGLKTTEVVKIPLQPVKNELDKWVLAEVYKTLGEMDEALNKYEIEPATKILLGFMDKLTNRYLRRSRRRFWAEGMDEDKQSAYTTLWEVLNIYLKTAAPFTPFIVEKIWLELRNFKTPHPNPLLRREGANKQSIHLEYWPLYSDKYVDKGLIEEVTIVRKIIKGAMYLRSKNQIKVKQPLRLLKFLF